MSNVLRQIQGSIGRIRISLASRDRASWHGFLLIIIGWAGIGLAFAVAGGSVLATVGLAVASIAAVGQGGAISVRGALSPTRHVFKSGPAFWTAAILLGTAASAAVVFVERTPFDGILGFGKPLPDLIAELTFVAAMAVCLVAGSIALREASQASRDERHWC